MKIQKEIQQWTHHNVSIDNLQSMCEALYAFLVHLFRKKTCKENRSLVCKYLLLTYC